MQPWEESWWEDRLVLDNRGCLIAEFGIAEEPDILEIRCSEEWATLEDNVDYDWVLQRTIDIGGVRMPAGACLLQRASLAAVAERPSPLPSLLPPMVIAFERTPWMRHTGEREPCVAMTALQPSGALRSSFLRLQARSQALHVQRFDLTGQRLGSNFVQALCTCLNDCRLTPEELLLGKNDLDDSVSGPLVEYMSTTDRFCWPLRQLVLDTNALTHLGADALISCMVECLRNIECPSQVCLYLDLSFNAIWDPKRLLDDAAWRYPETHAPCGDCSKGWCAQELPRALHLNAGPAWNSVEAANCAVFDKWWRRFMHGPTVLLRKTLEEEFGEALESERWTCPLDHKKVNPYEGRKNCPEVTFCSILSNHIRGKAHRKKVCCGYSTDSSAPENCFPDSLEFCFDGKSYHFHPLTGSQGWRLSDTAWEASPCEFLRPEWWDNLPSDCGVDLSEFASSEIQPQRSVGGVGSCNREARAIIVAYRFGQFRCDASRVELYESETVHLNLSPDSGAPQDYLSGTYEFAWRKFVASRNYAVGWPPVSSVAIESHATALDYNGDPAVYLVFEFEGSGIRALLQPSQRPLFEDGAGFLVSLGAWPRSLEGSPTSILATRASHVYEAFKATNAQRVRRLQMNPSSGIAGAPGGFNKDVDDYLVTHCGYARDQILDSETECSCVEKVIGHRVRLDPETHRWTADPDLDQGFWSWLGRRAQGHSKPDELLALRQLSASLATLEDEQVITSEQFREAALKMQRELRVLPACRPDLISLADALDHFIACGSCMAAGSFQAKLRQYLQVEEQSVHVDSVFYTQTSIASSFLHGQHYGQPLELTIKELHESPELVSTHPAFILEGAYFCGRMRVINNRRLYCLKQALPSGCQVRVRVFPLSLNPRFRTREGVLFMEKFLDAMKESSSDAGFHIRVRGRSQGGASFSSSSARPTHDEIPRQEIVQEITSLESVQADEPKGFASADYDAIEIAMNSRRELGYLSLSHGEAVYRVVGPPAPGHAANRFGEYLFGSTFRGSGWFPAACYEPTPVFGRSIDH